MKTRRLFGSMILLLLISITISCNLEGSGIFLSISEAEESANLDLSSETISNIIFTDDTTMMIQYGSTLRIRDDITDDSSDTSTAWNEVSAFSGLVADSAYAGGTYYIQLRDADHEIVTTSVSSYAAMNTSTDPETDAADELITDTTIYTVFDDTEQAFAVYEHSDGTLRLKALSGTADIEISSDTDMTANSNSFSIAESDTISHVFINTYVDETYSSYYLEYNADTFTSPVLVDSSDVSGYLVGGCIDEGNLFLYDTSGDVFRTAAVTFDPSTSTFTSILESDDYLLDLEDPRKRGIPTVKVDDEGTTYALISGDTDLYIIELNATTSVTTDTVDGDSGTFYNAFEDDRVIDFYDTRPDDNDYIFYVAAEENFVLKTTAEDDSSVQL